MARKSETIPEQPAESTHERILRVAAEIFARKGYHATGVAELGDAAGIKRGALYYHISSKEDLLFDLSKRHVEEALVRGREIVATTSGAVPTLTALVLEHVRMLAARRAEVTVVMHEMYALTGEREARFKALRHEYQDLFAEVLQRGVAEGVFRTAQPIDVLCVLGMLNYTYVWLDPNGPVPVDEVAARITDLILHGELVHRPVDGLPGTGRAKPNGRARAAVAGRKR